MSPLQFAVTRFLERRFWVETVTESEGSGPQLVMDQSAEIQPPREGAGPLNHRSYAIRISQPDHDAARLLELFRADPNRFSPHRLAVFVPDPAPEGLRIDDDVDVKIPGPWDGPVRVTRLDHCCIRLATRQGHMEAGWIEFSASPEPDGTVIFMIESYARSGDPVFDTLYHRVGIAKYMQSEMWVQVLEAVLDASGGTRVGRIQLRTTIYKGADV